MPSTGWIQMPPRRWISPNVFSESRGSDVIKRLDEGVIKTCMLDEKANGRLQWLLSPHRTASSLHGETAARGVVLS